MANIPVGHVGSSTTQMANCALRFDATKGHHVNHGYKWAGNTDYFSCFYEAWVCPSGTMVGYVISDGYGGAHNVLFGLSGDESGGYIITGNFNDGVNANTYASFDRIYANEWHHIAVSYSCPDDAVVVYIDGIPSGTITYTGAARNTLANSGVGVYFVGGSDHSNYNGLIKSVRGYEWGVNTDYPIPYNAFASPKNLLCFTPEKAFRGRHQHPDGTVITANSLFDYSVRTFGTIPDMAGSNHGKRACQLGEVVHDAGAWGVGGIYNQVEAFYDSQQSNYPRWVSSSLVAPTFSGSLTAIPAGAIVYDDFQRADITYSWNNPDLGVGAARTGQTPTGAYDEYFGIRDGQMFCSYPAASNLVWEAGVSNQDVTLTRRTPATEQANRAWGMVVRYTDDNNYISIYGDGTGYNVITRIAGSDTNIANGNHDTANFTSLRFVCNGNTGTLYFNGVQKGGSINITGTGSGTKAGVRTGDPLARFESFLIKAA